MPIFKKSFDSYRIWYYSAPQYNWKAILQLYSSNSYVGRITFMKKDQPIPANYESNGLPYLYMSFNDMEHIIFILNHDKPLHIQLNSDNGIGLMANSAREPIGEQEPL